MEILKMFAHSLNQIVVESATTLTTLPDRSRSILSLGIITIVAIIRHIDLSKMRFLLAMWMEVHSLTLVIARAVMDWVRSTGLRIDWRERKHPVTSNQA